MDATTSTSSSQVCEECGLSFTDNELFIQHVIDCNMVPSNRKRLLSQDDLSTTVKCDSFTNLPQQISSTLDQQFECHGGFRYKIVTSHTADHNCYPPKPITTSSSWYNYRRKENVSNVSDAVSAHMADIYSEKCPYLTCVNKTTFKKKFLGCELMMDRLAKTNRMSKCHKCGENKWYSNLKEHLLSCVGEGIFCPCCETILVNQSEQEINTHFLQCARVKYPCRKRCGSSFTSAPQREAHSRLCNPRNNIHTGDPSSRLREDGLMISAIDNNFRIIQITPTNSSNDYETTLEQERGRVTDILTNHLQSMKSLKFYLSINIECKKLIEDEFMKTANFRSTATPLLESTDLSLVLEQHFCKIAEKVEKYSRNGSGYVMEGLSELNIYVCKYTPLAGGSWIALPSGLETKKANLLNIQTTDDSCFVYSCLAAKHPLPRSKKNVKNQPKSYDNHLEELDIDGLSFPMELKEIKKFEEKNNFRVNVIGYDDIETEDNEGEIRLTPALFPLYYSDNQDPSATEANLLLLKNETNQHYVLITNLSGLLRKGTRKNKKHYCIRCFHGFTKPKTLKKHLPDCLKFKLQATEMPYDSLLTYTSFRNEVELPAFTVADFECVLVRVVQTTPGGATTIIDQHKPCGYSLKVVTPFQDYKRSIITYRGPDAAEHFVKTLDEVHSHLKPLFDRNVTMLPLTPQQEDIYKATSQCYLCLRYFGARRDLSPESKENFKVHDHCHYSGQYLGPAHRLCNLERKTDKRIPLLFHNLRGYDSHLFVEELCKEATNLHSVRLIPKTLESYSAIITPKYRILDSIQHLTFSLDKLVDNLTNGGTSDEHLHVLKEHVEERYGPNSERKLKLLSRKGCYPYSYMNSFDKFDEGLPPREAFHNNLTDSHISDEDWLHVQEVWEEFGLLTLGDLHDLYVEGDTLLLGDIIQKYRKLVLKEYKLDPLHFYTLPGLAFQACLRYTRVELELIKDMEMFLMIEKSIRGGISVISKRHAVANNPQLKDYDPQKESSHLLYIDSTNLYGKAMSEKVPVGGFVWVKNGITPEFIMEYDANSTDQGYILEVDIDIPEEIHQQTDDYPLCPEHLDINEGMLSNHSKGVRETRGGKTIFHGKKLAPNLFNKTKYVTDIRNLQFYLKQGAILKTVHRVIRFKQEAWIEPYITHNTNLRNSATDDMGKALFKLLNNALFGKTIESVRRRISVVLLDTATSARWQTNKTGFKRFTVFNPNLVAVECVKPRVVLDKPIYVGFTVLEISKRIMMNMHYDVIKAKYPNEKSALCFTDTDSFLYHISTGDLNQDMVDMGMFDFSNYPTDHPLKSQCTQNNGKLGYFKNETKGQPIKEFIGLRSKMYSILVENTVKQNGVITTRLDQKATAAGIKTSVKEKELLHERYREALHSGGNDQYINQKTIRSTKHRLHTIAQTRVALTAYDDKRFVLTDHSTKAHGNCLNSYFEVVDLLGDIIEK